MCEKCKVTPAVIGRAAGRKAQREHDAKVAADALRAYHGQAAAPRLTATQYAERVLMVVGGIVLLASMNFLLHALLISLAVLFAAVSTTAVVVTVRRRKRRLRTVIPAPLEGRYRTAVESVTVRSLPRAPEQGSDARRIEAGQRQGVSQRHTR
jgi:hypothetical protein